MTRQTGFLDGVKHILNELVNRRNPMNQNVMVARAVPDHELRQIYRTGIGSKIIRIKVNGALRDTLQFSSKKDQSFYDNELSASVREAAKFMLGFGRGAIVLHRRGEDTKSPWVPGRPGKVIMRVFSGDMVFPHGVDVDLESPRYMMPSAYQIRATTFHHSRIIDFSYVRPPELDLPAYRYGGVSEFELIHGQLINDGIVERASVMALEKNSVPTIKVKGLKQSLQAGHESQMLKYFQVMEDAAHIAGARLIDGDDDIDLTTLTLTALAEADMIAMRRLSMVTGIPLPQLMGESVRGMNSSGETERLVFREMLMDLQSDFLRDPINQLMRKFGCGQVWFLENQGDTPGSRIAYEKTALENAKALYEMGEDHRAYLLEKDILKKDDMSRFFGGSDSADEEELDLDELDDDEQQVLLQ